MRHIVSNRYRRLAAATAIGLFAFFGARLAAHDFWIQPSAFRPSPDGLVRVQLRVGDDFPGEPVVRDAAKIASFIILGPQGQQPIAGMNGADPAGILRVTSPGTYVIGYRSNPSAVTLTAAAFEAYLKEEGLERISDLRAKAGTSGAPGREHFSRSAKSLLHVGSSPPEGHDAILGMTLELVPETHPSALPSDGRLGFRLLHEGQPAEGVLVVAVPQSGPRGNQAKRTTGRTSADGRATLTLAPGAWTIKAVHMVPAAEGSGADWQSIWASLTFEAGSPAPTAR